MIMFTEQDLQNFRKKGVSVEQINRQLKNFEDGFSYLRLDNAASVGNGIYVPDNEQCKMFSETWETYCKGEHVITKFVPASGAASRMFKDLFGFLNAGYDKPSTDFEKKFFANIDKFAFFDSLNGTCIRLYGKDIDCLIKENQYKSVVSALLNKEGMSYGSLPKGLLQFHKYGDGVRTPFHEHLVEGALYASCASKVNLHFTVSHEHKELFAALSQETCSEYGRQYGVDYNISFSEQKPSTDTIAVDMENEPFRNADGSILFRPGGHGALIENLDAIDSDIIFIKNIDNVVPDRLKGDTVEYKKLIAGILVHVQNRIFEFLEMLDNGSYSENDIKEMLSFLNNVLYCRMEGIGRKGTEEQTAFIKNKLNRPLRVCGMVKNVGEPGGGPFLAYGADNTVQLQILESSQIDMDNADSKAMFVNGTHFNPVDLVCAVKDYKGRKFDLTGYVDPETGFISQKSKDGRELKALELPGLWNGAMSNWNTIFVEVPLATFNPVKTVNDLLRDQHQ